MKPKLLWLFAALSFLPGCASTIYGTPPPVAHGPGQVAVDVGYRNVDKIYIAVTQVAPTGKVNTTTLQAALDTAYATELATDIIFLPPRAVPRSAATDVIGAAAAVLAATLQMAAADYTFDSVIRQMQANGQDRQSLTPEELKTIKDKLTADRSAAQTAIARLAGG